MHIEEQQAAYPKYRDGDDNPLDMYGFRTLKTDEERGEWIKEHIRQSKTYRLIINSKLGSQFIEPTYSDKDWLGSAAYNWVRRDATLYLAKYLMGNTKKHSLLLSIQCSDFFTGYLGSCFDDLMFHLWDKDMSIVPFGEKLKIMKAVSGELLPIASIVVSNDDSKVKKAIATSILMAVGCGYNGPLDIILKRYNLELIYD